MTHDSFNVSEEVVREFEKDHQAMLRILKSGDAGAALNQAYCPGTTRWPTSFSGWTTPS
jgi:ABC-type thiamine transport system substrate-binding protein